MAVDDQLAYSVAHDPCRAGDREPLGAVPAGAWVNVALRVHDGAWPQVLGACALVGERATDGHLAWVEVPLEPSIGRFEGSFCPEMRPHVVFYVFRLQLADGSEAYYVPRADGRATAGELAVAGVDGDFSQAGWSFYGERLAARPGGDFGLAAPLPGFQVTVHDPDFSTPDWLAGAVMYQIFPDRFARGQGGVRADGVAYHERMGRPVHLHATWNEAVEWVEDATYDPVDFFGGTLEGIREKLPYLASLGVEVLYLNPVFEARSNHRYDTADYERIDPLLGTADDFRCLAREASEQGISIVLDAVLSHTGDDSRYFDAQGVYDGSGAMRGEGSPYRSWYDFGPQHDGAPYRSWWGFASLPEVNERDASWQRYLLGDGCGDPGVLGTWLAAGARGYRLDVADEIPDDVLALIRARVKAADSQAAIIGEVWEDATTKVSYGLARDYALGPALDSTMNYPLRNALVGFAIGWLDAHQLAAFLRMQQANYPRPLYRCLMNLLSTHDVERVRSVLALGRPLKGEPREEQRSLAAGIDAVHDARAAQLQRLVVGLLYALPGCPCVYYGDERGLQGGGDPFCRATFPWDEAATRADVGQDLTGFYREVGRRRKGSEALRSANMACAAATPDVVFAVRWSDDAGDLAIAAANRADEPALAVVDFLSPALALPDRVRDAAKARFGADHARIDIPPCQTVVVQGSAG